MQAHAGSVLAAGMARGGQAVKPLPLFLAATAKARKLWRIAPHGQRQRYRKQYERTVAAQLRTETSNAD
jgi:hypothetical protein